MRSLTSSLSAETYITAAERSYREKVIDMLNAHLVAAMGGPTRRKLEDGHPRLGSAIQCHLRGHAGRYSLLKEVPLSHLPADRNRPNQSQEDLSRPGAFCPGTHLHSDPSRNIFRSDCHLFRHHVRSRFAIILP